MSSPGASGAGRSSSAWLPRTCGAAHWAACHWTTRYALLPYRYATRGVTAFDARHADLLDASDPAQRHQAVAATVEASLGLFTHDDQARYRELAVFHLRPAHSGRRHRRAVGTCARPRQYPTTCSASSPTCRCSPLIGAPNTCGCTICCATTSSRLTRRSGWCCTADWSKAGVLRSCCRTATEFAGTPTIIDTAGDSERALRTDHSRLARTGPCRHRRPLRPVAADALCAAEHAARHHQLHEELRCRLIATTLAARAQALPRRLLSRPRSARPARPAYSATLTCSALE